MRAGALGLGILLVMAGMAAWIAGPPSGAGGVAIPPVATVSAQTPGCPACHGAAGKQPSLDAVAKKVKNHPVSAAKTVQQCALCHTKGPTPAPFRTALHKIHLASATFAGAPYKGTCTSCHNVDKATGAVTVYGLQRP